MHQLMQNGSAPAHDCESPFGARGHDLSIIIPSYNCAKLLRDTLLSLKAQPEEFVGNAQILVIDDCSTKDDPEAVVRSVWPDRVGFYRQPQNVGPCENFNTCLDRAERPWIHILHGDDYVLPGGYQEFATCLSLYPDALAVFARSVIINEKGYWSHVSFMLGKEERGRLSYDPTMWSENPVLFPGALVSREVIELVGKFDCSFCHVQDWNLWWRIAKSGRAVYSNNCVAAYRDFEGNHTSSLISSGRNFDEILEQVERVVASVEADAAYAGLKREELYLKSYKQALRQCSSYIGTSKCFAANYRIFKRFPPALRKTVRLKWIYLQHLEHLLRRRLSIRSRLETVESPAN